MSELPPNIDAILASIRARINDDTPVQPETPQKPPEVITKPAAAAASIGAVALDGGAMTLDGLVRSMLEPILKAWLDANMPEIVERMAQAEIKRLTGRD